MEIDRNEAARQYAIAVREKIGITKLREVRNKARLPNYEGVPPEGDYCDPEALAMKALAEMVGAPVFLESDDPEKVSTIPPRELQDLINTSLAIARREYWFPDDTGL